MKTFESHFITGRMEMGLDECRQTERKHCINIKQNQTVKIAQEDQKRLKTKTPKNKITVSCFKNTFLLALHMGLNHTQWDLQTRLLIRILLS